MKKSITGIVVLVGVFLLIRFFSMSGTIDTEESNPTTITETKETETVIDDSVPQQEQEPIVTSQMFVDMFKDVTYKNIIPAYSIPVITGDIEVDNYIRAKAENRGYKRRAISEESALVSYQGQRLQQEAKDALVKMQTEAKKEGLVLTFVSGYRSPDYQREIFLKKFGTPSKADVLSGKKDSLLASILEVSSIPGYSKHHSGYTIDIACNSYELTNAFTETPCYVWLSEDSFKNTRTYGFIPSYPVGIGNQGPDPESWEFVFIPELL